MELFLSLTSIILGIMAIPCSSESLVNLLSILLVCSQSINKNDRAGSRDTNDLSKAVEPDKDGTEPGLEHKPPGSQFSAHFYHLCQSP